MSIPQSTVGDDDRQPRAIKHTERDEQYYESQKNTFIKEIQTSAFILEECIRAFDTFPKSLSPIGNAETSLQSAYQR